MVKCLKTPKKADSAGLFQKIGAFRSFMVITC